MENRGVFTINPASNLKADAVDIEEALDVVGHGRHYYFLLIACYITHMGSVIDMMGYSIVVPAAKCDLKLTMAQSRVLTSISFAGFIFASPWGYFADTQGRRKALLISTTFGFIFTAISSFSTNFFMMMTLKFIGCSFSTACLTLTTTYLGECVRKKYRSRVIIIQNIFCVIGDFVCFALAFVFLPLNIELPISSTFAIKSWRLLTLTLALPLGVGGLMSLFLHESPKFLANKGETSAALAVLKSMYLKNGGSKANFPIKALKGNMRKPKAITFCESIINQTVPIFKPPLLWKSIQLLYLFTICCASNNVFFVMFPTMINAFYNNADDRTKTLSFCQRILSNVTPTVVDENESCSDETPIKTIYVGMVLTGLFVCINTALIKPSSWRKLLLIIILLLSACGAALVTLFENTIANIIFFSMIQLTGLCVGIVGSYFVDIYPTSYRGLATSLGMMVARVSCVGGVNLIGVLITDHCELTFFSWAFYVLSGIVAVVLLPDE